MSNPAKKKKKTRVRWTAYVSQS